MQVQLDTDYVRSVAGRTVGAVLKERDERDSWEGIADRLDLTHLVDREIQALSGGERQRVAVARALLKRPALLLCDEATSALDPLIERSVVEVLNAASANVTTVLVAHKLQTVVDADLILVMSDGLLVEQGTHTSLLCQANSTYARMWAEQASGFGGAARADGGDLDYCKLALDDQPYVPWSAASPARSQPPAASIAGECEPIEYP